MDHEYFMSKVIELALENIRSNKGEPFGSLIIKDGKIIGTGTCNIFSQNDPTAHAIILSIRNACKALGTDQLNGCILYTNCEPCPMCQIAVNLAKIQEVFFANTREELIQLGYNDSVCSTDSKVPCHKLGSTDAIKVFKEWGRE